MADCSSLCVSGTGQKSAGNETDIMGSPSSIGDSTMPTETVSLDTSSASIMRLASSARIVGPMSLAVALLI